MNVALLLVRVVVGVLLVGHGAQKLFGWFGGHGLAGTGTFFESIGYRPGKLMAFAAGAGELAGGALLAAGFLSPLAAAVVVGVMVNAASVHLANGPWVTNQGYELPLTYAAVGAAIGFAGPGRYSLDRAFDWTLSGNGWGVVALAVGAVSAAAVIGLRAANLRVARGLTPATR